MEPDKWAEIRQAEEERQRRQWEADAEKERLAAAERERQRLLEVDRLKLSYDRQREAGPAERMLPGAGDQIREAAKLKEPEPEPVREVVAERLELSRERQAAPSMPGLGTVFVNDRVRQAVTDRSPAEPGQSQDREPERKPEPEQKPAQEMTPEREERIIFRVLHDERKRGRGRSMYDERD